MHIWLMGLNHDFDDKKRLFTLEK